MSEENVVGCDVNEFSDARGGKCHQEITGDVVTPPFRSSSDDFVNMPEEKSAGGDVKELSDIRSGKCDHQISGDVMTPPSTSNDNNLSNISVEKGAGGEEKEFSGVMDEDVAQQMTDIFVKPSSSNNDNSTNISEVIATVDPHQNLEVQGVKKLVSLAREDIGNSTTKCPYPMALTVGTDYESLIPKFSSRTCNFVKHFTSSPSEEEIRSPLEQTLGPETPDTHDNQSDEPTALVASPPAPGESLSLKERSMKAMNINPGNPDCISDILAFATLSLALSKQSISLKQEMGSQETVHGLQVPDISPEVLELTPTFQSPVSQSILLERKTSIEEPVLPLETTDVKSDLPILSTSPHSLLNQQKTSTQEMVQHSEIAPEHPEESTAPQSTDVESIPSERKTAVEMATLNPKIVDVRNELSQVIAPPQSPIKKTLLMGINIEEVSLKPEAVHIKTDCFQGSASPQCPDNHPNFSKCKINLEILADWNFDGKPLEEKIQAPIRNQSCVSPEVVREDISGFDRSEKPKVLEAAHLTEELLNETHLTPSTNSHSKEGPAVWKDIKDLNSNHQVSNVSAIDHIHSSPHILFFEGPIGYGEDVKDTDEEPPSKLVVHHCSLCSIIVGYTEDSLQCHLQEHHWTSLECKVCKRKFSTTKSFQDHAITHVRYPCLHCPKEYNAPWENEEHQAQHFRNKIFRCDKCGEEFYLKSTLKQHQIFFEGKCSEKPVNRRMQEQLGSLRIGKLVKCTSGCSQMISRSKMAVHINYHEQQALDFFTKEREKAKRMKLESDM